MKSNLKHSLFNLNAVIALLVFISSTACVKTTDEPNPPGPSGAITGFSFSQDNNSIPVSSDATIDGTNVTIFLPPGTNVSALKPSFTLSGGATASINGVTQQSGVTVVDFTEPVTYTISSPGSNDAAYTVTLITDISAIDDNVIGFMEKYNVPGLTIAITKDDRLVYSKAYGFADTSAHTPATTSSLFRLADDSKQFTSAAIMKLIDEGKITIDDKIFGTGAILGTTYGTQPYGLGVTDMNVSDLLHNTQGGWSANGSANTGYSDPMFSNLSLTNDELISWTLNNQPLDTLPNTQFEYSNFAYFLLARIIEKITGEPYAQAVQDLVLTPSGITDMSIAGNTLAQRKPNEAVYYSQDGISPYDGLNITRADGCSGWVATAVDMVKLMTHIDQVNSLNDIISSNAYNVMTFIIPASASNNYACGWGAYSNNSGFEHEGSLPGVISDQAFSTILMSPANTANLSFAILVNGSNDDASFGGDLDNIFWNALPINAWPSYDLFKDR